MYSKISVIVPVYNVEEYLTRCIDSIINQTYHNIEIILVDDGSTDKSGCICDSYAKIDSRIKVIHKKNGGLSDARNVGIDNSNGDYISFIDSDDYADSQMIETLYTVALQYNCDIVECSYYLEYPDGNKYSNSTCGKNIELSGQLAVEDVVQCKNFKTVSWNKLYNRKLFEEVRFPFGKINEDDFTTYKLFVLANKVVKIDKPLYYYYQREGSIMLSKFSIRNFDLLEATTECLDYIEISYPMIMPNILSIYYFKGFDLLFKLILNKKTIKNSNFYIKKYKSEILNKDYLKKYGRLNSKFISIHLRLNILKISTFMFYLLYRIRELAK